MSCETACNCGMTEEDERFSDEQLKAVIGLLAGPGAVWELKFGSWVLLQPERINAYAQAVIQTLREDQFERGCIPEERVLAGDLTYHSSIPAVAGGRRAHHPPGHAPAASRAGALPARAHRQRDAARSFPATIAANARN